MVLMMMMKMMCIKLLLMLIIFKVCITRAAIIKVQDQQEAEHANNKTAWELMEALYATSGVRGFNGTWITDEEFYYTATDKSIHKYNARIQTDTIFVSPDFLNTYSGASFTLSPDNNKILVRYATEAIFRHSYVAKYDIYDIATKRAKSINDGNKLQYCGWSPFKDRLAFVYENNVKIHYENDTENIITTDGVQGIIYNGVPDWVYEEEVLSSGNAMWWSPDGAKIAVGFFNDTKVETYKYFIYGNADDPEYQYPKEIELKYPKPGTPNPVVALKIYDVIVAKPQIIITAPVDIVGTDHILQNVVWANSTHLLITWLNRRQNVATIQSCSSEGACREILRLSEPNGWIEISSLKPLNAGKNCLFRYWIDNWLQIWNLNLETGLNNWKSRGNFTVLNIYGYDETYDRLYYQATLGGDPSVYQVFSNDDCLTCNLIDVDGAACRSASASFSKNFSYYTVTCSGPNPIYTRIFESKTNTLIRDWEPNKSFREKLETKMRSIYKFMNVTLADGSIGFAKLVLPPNFDKTKKYPLIVNVYGGPDSVRVTNGFTVGYEGFVSTKREIIYAYIDGRGTGNKGKSLLFTVNNDLGDHEVEDQLFVTKWFQDNLPYVDRERCGIWGWSYGGYMTAKTLAADDDRIFQCGISVAPVTSWLYYDTIYTERYMGMPTLKDNQKHYEISSVFNKLKNFNTHDFLLIHGSGDDNVHYQHSLLLAKLLQKNDIQFQEQTYPDENHSISNFAQHLYHTIDNFWINCLNLNIDENEI